LPLVFVIVITCNGLRHLEGCFRSLRRTEYPNYCVILVDNGSSDGGAEFTRTHFPEVQVLRFEINLGFAGGNNRALEVALAAAADYVFLLNDDTEIVDPSWLSEAIALAEQRMEIGMIGFQLLEKLPILEEIAQHPPPTTPAAWQPVKRIDGCALFIRGNLLRRIGLFDEVYFAYAEEDDLETRTRRTGAELVVIDRRIYHFGGGTSKRFPVRAGYLQVRNWIRYSIKNRSFLRTVARVFKLLDVTCNPFPLFYERDDYSHQRARGQGRLLVNVGLFLTAVGWNLLHLPETLAARRTDRRRERGEPA
jgi:GT2 family glycosyltransferase